MNQATPRLSIVLPCFNGSPYIRQSLHALHAWLESHGSAVGPAEMILVDDGSSDDTVAVATASGVPVRLVRHARNRGKGAAVRSGMSEARGAYRLFMDADLPFDLVVIERMLHYLEFKEFHVCVGSRATRGSSYVIERPSIRRLASLIFAEFVGRLVVTGVRDTQCGVKGFQAAVAEYLFGQARVDSFAFDIELLYLAFKNGFDVKSIPVQVVTEEPTTVKVVRDGVPMLLEVMKLPVRFHRGVYRLYDATAPRCS